MVTIHYHRTDDDYEGVSIWTWDRDGNRQPVSPCLEPMGWDDYGPYFQFNSLDYGLGSHAKSIGFLPRLRHDWEHKDGDDRYWTPSMGQSIWIVGGDNEIHLTRPDTSPKVQAAYIDGDRLVTIRLSHGMELGRLVPRSFVLRSAAGAMLNVVAVRALDASRGRARLLELTTTDPINLRFRTVVLVEGYRPANALLRGVLFDGSRFGSTLPMGAIHTPDATTFRVFAPVAEMVELVLYSQPVGSAGREAIIMQPIGGGAWETVVKGDLHGRFYRWRIQNDTGEPPREIVDIMARCTTGHDGHGMIVDLRRTDPTGFRPTVRPATIEHPCDAVIIEYSVRDFTRHPSSGVAEIDSGGYLGFVRSGTLLPGTQIPTGIDHLMDLGVTHVQVLPVHDFDNREDSDEYNWGYMTANFNSPDGWYASDHRTAARVTEFKQMVKALHGAGIRVIMDVVYNHSAPCSGFEGIAPRYYHRRRDDGQLWNGSGTGNEFHSEAPMGRRFIVDSCRYWIEEYGVDGFRFDLMGLIDLDTMVAVRDELRAIDPTLLLYGEPWAATGQDGTGVRPITYKNRIAGTGIGAFNDHFRNELKGSPDGAEAGFVQTGANRDGIKKGLMGSIHDWASQPGEAIQYATCHDNLCLWDKLQLSAPEADEFTLLRMQMLTNGILAVSQGVMFLHGGEEFARTKYGHHNSYNAPDLINAVDWSRKRTYQDLYNHTRGMIALRRAHPIFRLRTRQEIENRLQFRDDRCPNSSCIAFRLWCEGVPGETWREAFVFINASEHDQLFPLPEGSWAVHAQGELAGVEKLIIVHENIPVAARCMAVVAR